MKSDETSKLYNIEFEFLTAYMNNKLFERFEKLKPDDLETLSKIKMDNFSSNISRVEGFFTKEFRPALNAENLIDFALPNKGIKSKYFEGQQMIK